MRLAAMILALGVGTATHAQTIVAANYTEPTDRYDHGILGDAIEHAGLQVTLSDGTTRGIVWPSQIVFEETAPRLMDVDGDGAPEVIVVESHEDFGARLSVIGWDGETLAHRASNDFIGRTHRWLAVAGAADMDGDGFVEIAYVDRPHLAKTLMIWRYVPVNDTTVRLEPVAELAGLTNHRIGERDIGGGMRVCGDVVEVITADENWSRVIATRLENGALVSRDVGPHSGRASLNAALAC
ncbi:MAG: VCBS repeat-containing protein [Yoonia sp.]